MPEKILVVDDSKTIRMQVNSAMSNHGYHVIEAEDGTIALDLLRRHPDVIVVFLDLNMPVLGGMETMKAIQKDDSIRLPNIIILTTEDSADRMEEAKKYGAKGWIVKPYNTKKLLDAVQRFSSS